MKANTCTVIHVRGERTCGKGIILFSLACLLTAANAQAQGGSARYIASGGADFVEGQGRVVDGSRGTERIDIGNGSVGFTGIFQAGVVRYVEQVAVEYKGTIEGDEVEVKYTLASEIERRGNSVFGHFYRNKNALLVGVLSSGQRKIAVSGSISFKSGRPTVQLSDLAVPKDNDVLSGWLLGKGTNIALFSFAECPFLKDTLVYPNEKAGLTSQRYAVLKLFPDYKVELVTNAKGTTRKHVDYSANDLDSLRERAEYADAIAQTKLSELYYTGKQGAPLDRVTAYKWAFIASTKTNRQAKALLDEYEMFLTPEEISKGKAAADAFLKSTNMISK